MRVYFIGARLMGVAMALIATIIGGYLLSCERTVPTVAEPVYRGPVEDRLVALTINVDWGQENIPTILETCRTKDVKVTFFPTGRWASKFPELTREMASAGHEIGSHGYGHPHPDQLSVEGNLRDMQRTEDVLHEFVGVSPRLYAPPYGERGVTVLKAAEQMGYTTILWSVDSIDWKYRDRDYILRRVVSRIHPGAIVLLHPTDATAAALPAMIEALKDEGYRLVTVSELLKPHRK